MRRLLGILTVAAFALAPANGSVLLGFVPADPIVVAPGGAFGFSVRLTLDGQESVLGFDYYLLAAGSNYQNGFAIFSRESYPAFFPELNTPDAEVVAPPEDAVLGSTNARSLGAAVGDVFAPLNGAGEYQVATFVIAVAPDAALGTFTIGSAFASWLDENFSEQVFASPAVISVQVVPEPSVLTLAIAGAGLIGLLRKRRCGRNAGTVKADLPRSPRAR